MNAVTAVHFDLASPTHDQFKILISGLSEEERHLLLDHGEETPFCGIFLTEKRDGVYACRLCGLPLFKGGTKFESGTGCRVLPGLLPKATCVKSATHATA
ncbi:MAG: peptide-methionine (R)-S-oxide reductase [Sphingomonadales bacterium]|jgi:peptide-methionine (R)-S-oxide reductase|nr:peptide-methionine (R)-S-oxide reductase [Sphingomonadales bacterium]